MANNSLLSNFLLFGLAGYVALVLSIILFALDMSRYNKRLQLKVSQVQIWNKGNESLALFHLILVNPSSAGRTVLTYSILPPTVIVGKEIFPLRDEQLQGSTYPLPTGENSPRYLDNEILLGSLDIPPYQSVNRIVGESLDLETAQRISFPVYKFWIFVQDVDGKQLAKTPVKLTKDQLTHDGTYPMRRYVRART